MFLSILYVVAALVIPPAPATSAPSSSTEENESCFIKVLALGAMSEFVIRHASSKTSEAVFVHDAATISISCNNPGISLRAVSRSFPTHSEFTDVTAMAIDLVLFSNRSDILKRLDACKAAALRRYKRKTLFVEPDELPPTMSLQCGVVHEKGVARFHFDFSDTRPPIIPDEESICR